MQYTIFYQDKRLNQEDFSAKSDEEARSRYHVSKVVAPHVPAGMEGERNMPNLLMKFPEDDRPVILIDERDKYPDRG